MAYNGADLRLPFETLADEVVEVAEKSKMAKKKSLAWFCFSGVFLVFLEGFCFSGFF